MPPSLPPPRLPINLFSPRTQDRLLASARRPRRRLEQPLCRADLGRGGFYLGQQLCGAAGLPLQRPSDQPHPPAGGCTQGEGGEGGRTCVDALKVRGVGGCFRLAHTRPSKGGEGERGGVQTLPQRWSRGRVACGECGVGGKVRLAQTRRIEETESGKSRRQGEGERGEMA